MFAAVAGMPSARRTTNGSSSSMMRASCTSEMLLPFTVRLMAQRAPGTYSIVRLSCTVPSSNEEQKKQSPRLKADSVSVFTCSVPTQNTTRLQMPDPRRRAVAFSIAYRKDITDCEHMKEEETARRLEHGSLRSARAPHLSI